MARHAPNSDKAATLIGIGPIAAIATYSAASGVGSLFDAWRYLQTPDAELTWFLYALDAARRLGFAAILGTLVVGAIKVPSQRTTLILVAGIVSLAVGSWLLLAATGQPGIGAGASVLAGTCAIAAAIFLRLHGSRELSSEN